MDTDLMDLFATTAVISAAQQKGLLRALGSGPKTAQAYAEQLGLDARATTFVLDALVGLDLAAREGESYVVSPRVKEFSSRWGQGRLNADNLWDHTAEFLRTGQPFLRMDGPVAEREKSYSGAVSALAFMMEGAARELASRLSSTLSEAPARVLDVGCGSGVWGLAIAERFPETRVTGLDLPAVLESFTARAKALGLEARTATIPGDMGSVAIPEGAFDLVVIANVLRLEPQDRAAALLARLAKGLAPGGGLLVVDALAGGTPERDKARAFYALNLALRTAGGRVHSPAEITGWLAAAGLRSVQTLDLGLGGVSPGALGALLAKR